MRHAWMRMLTEFWLQNLKKTGHLEDLGVCGIIILN